MFDFYKYLIKINIANDFNFFLKKIKIDSTRYSYPNNIIDIIKIKINYIIENNIINLKNNFTFIIVVN